DRERARGGEEPERPAPRHFPGSPPPRRGRNMNHTETATGTVRAAVERWSQSPSATSAITSPTALATPSAIGTGQIRTGRALMLPPRDESDPRGARGAARSTGRGR